MLLFLVWPKATYTLRLEMQAFILCRSRSSFLFMNVRRYVYV